MRSNCALLVRSRFQSQERLAVPAAPLTTQSFIRGIPRPWKARDGGNVAEQSRTMHPVSVERPPIHVVLAMTYLALFFGAAGYFFFLTRQ